MGSDRRRWRCWRGWNISIHAPRVGSDDHVASPGSNICSISIHAPRVGSDGLYGHGHHSAVNFNPRSPCGGRLAAVIHISPVSNFNPRSPCGERRGRAGTGVGSTDISIHAPRVGSDITLTANLMFPDDFNPRSPCGERQRRKIMDYMHELFQSTLPLWGATMASNWLHW